MATLATYLPVHLRRIIGRKKPSLKVPGSEHLEGALLFCHLASADDDSLATLVNSLHHWGGSILELRPTEVLGVITGANPVSRAQSVIDDCGELGDVTAYIHWGAFEAHLLGTERSFHHVAVGSAVETMARHMKPLSGGRVGLSPQAKRQAANERSARPSRARIPKPPAALVRAALPRRFSTLRKHPPEGSQTALMLETRGRGLAALVGFYTSLGELVAESKGWILDTRCSAQGLLWTILLPSVEPSEAGKLLSELVKTPFRGVKVRGVVVRGALELVDVGSRDRRALVPIGLALDEARERLEQCSWGETQVVTLVHSLKRAGRLPFVGREAEVEQIRERLERLMGGSGATLAVIGEEGTGRSRLLREARRLARDFGVRGHSATAAVVGTMPNQLIGDLLLDVLGLSRSAAHHEVMARIGDELDRLDLDPAFVDPLADLVGVRHWDTPLAHLEGRDVRRNGRIALRELLSLLSDESPLLLTLDDMDAADVASREFIEDLRRDLQEKPVLFLVGHVPEYALQGPADALILGELDEEFAHAMLRPVMEAIGVSPLGPDRTPLGLTLFASHLLDGGGGPADADGMILSRMQRLDPPGREALRQAATLGVVCSIPVLGRALPDGVTAVLLDELAEDAWGVVDRSKELFVFQHPRVRAAVYRSIPERDRAPYHLSAAQAIDGMYLNERRAFLAALAHHWERAGELRMARTCFAAAGRRAVSVHALSDAARFYRGYLALVAQPNPRSVLARQELASHVLARTGRHDEAERELMLAVEEARGLSDSTSLASSLLGLAALKRSTARMDEAQSHYEEAALLHREAGQRKQEAAVLLNLALLHHDQGRLEQARRLYRKGIDAIREIGARKQEGVFLQNLARLELQEGDPRAATANLEAALRAHREVGNRRLECVVLAELAGITGARGELEDARDYFEQAQIVAGKIGDRRREAVALLGLARLERWSGGLLAAERCEQAMKLLVRFGEPRDLVLGLCERGHLAIAQSRPARDLLEQARGMAEVIAPSERAPVLMALLRLDRAVRIHEAGGALPAGECREDPPDSSP